MMRPTLLALQEGTRKCNKGRSVCGRKYGHADNVTDRRGGERGEGFMPHIKQLSSATAENYVTGHAHAPSTGRCHPEMWLIFLTMQ